MREMVWRTPSDEIWIDQTEKRTWFLFEAARGASNDGH